MIRHIARFAAVLAYIALLVIASIWTNAVTVALIAVPPALGASVFLLVSIWVLTA